MRKLTTRKDLRRKTTILSRSPERTATKSKLKNRKLSKVAARKLKERRVLRSERMQHKRSALTGLGSEDSSDAAHTSHSSSNDSSTSYSSSDSEEIASSSENTPKRARGKKLKRARSTSSHELRSGKRARHNQDVNNMFTAFSAHAKGAKLESFRWTEARAASCWARRAADRRPGRRRVGRPRTRSRSRRSRWILVALPSSMAGRARG